MKFRKLRADEIDVRVGIIFSRGYSLLLYKDARCDMNILDETVGAENWQRDHKEIKGNLYCGVAIYDEKKSQWIWKWDCGTESNTEKEKGEASDSFKRACFNWGIGRELYTKIKIIISCETVAEKIGNKTVYKLPAEEQKRSFRVQEIGYNDKGEIDKLIVVDNKGIQAFTKETTTQQAQTKRTSQYSGQTCELCDEDVTDKVASYSKQNYGKVLCMKCQKSQPVKGVEV